MIFKPLKLKGVYLIRPERKKDERGFFMRVGCEREFKKHGLSFKWVQHSVSFNRKKGTLRGMHYQAGPYSEIKLVRCTRGAVYDVVLDLRPRSKSFKKWIGIKLNAEKAELLYIPNGFAHGFVTLTPDTEMFYLISEFYRPDKARGIRWDDPRFKIRWPKGKKFISSRDKAL